MSLSSICRRSSPRHSTLKVFQTTNDGAPASSPGRRSLNPALGQAHPEYGCPARAHSTDLPGLGIRRELRPWLSSRALPTTSDTYSRQARRQQHTLVPAQPAKDSNRARLRAIVDIYPSFQLPTHKSRIRQDRHGPVQFQHNSIEHEYKHGNQQNGDGAPGSVPKPAEKSGRIILSPDAATARQVSELQCLLRDHNTTPDALFAAYRLLPQPRLAYLSFPTIRLLQTAIRNSDRKTRHSMIRYFTLLDDMSVAKIPLGRNEWNLATSFAARWADEVGEHNVNTAMQMFLRMEREAGIVGNNVTFNILFDMAARAERFGLAEVVLEEMERREISSDVFLYTSKIFYHGMRRDGDGVRQTYRDLVDAGEVVDVKVLTCVIVSLIRAGEAGAGEQVFERMKAMARDETRDAYAELSARTGLGSSESMTCNNGLLTPSRPELIKLLPTSAIAPNVHTYRALIRHHANRTGNIDRVIELLLDMQHCNLNWHGSLFWQIFSGFRRHGGIRFTSWTIRRLDEIWRLFLARVDRAAETDPVPNHLLARDERPCCMNLQIATAALLAHAKCGDFVLVKQVWRDIATRWTPDDEELDQIKAVLRDIKQRQEWSEFD